MKEKNQRISPPSAIVTNNLTRVFKSTIGVFRRSQKEKIALKDINLCVENGQLFGLLGPNGSGKTTLVKILTTVLLPTFGTAEVLGMGVVEQAKDIRSYIGVIFGGERGLYWRLSGYDNLQYFADLYKVPTAVVKKRIPELLELVGLSDAADERVENYSRGMKQRLHIARSLINDPDVLFLDEPTIGLDPVAARELRETIYGLKARGKTIFLTSHYMYEIDALCDQVAVLNRGQIIMVDTPSTIKQLVADQEVVEIECYGVSKETIAQLRLHPAVTTVQVETREQTQVLHIQAPAGAELVQEFLNLLNSTHIIKLVTRQPTLEDAYVRLVNSNESPS